MSAAHVGDGRTRSGYRKIFPAELLIFCSVIAIVGRAAIRARYLLGMQTKVVTQTISAPKESLREVLADDSYRGHRTSAQEVP